MPHKAKRYLLVGFVPLVTLACSGREPLRALPDAAGTGGAVIVVSGADAPPLGATGGTAGTGSTSQPATGGMGTQAGTGGASGGATTAMGPDASSTGGKGGTTNASVPEGGRTGGTFGSGGASGPDARTFDAAVPPDGGRDGGDAEISGVCSEVPCLAELFLPCRPDGLCTMDSVTDPATGEETKTYCYANGVKQQSVVVATDELTTGRFTEKLDHVVCFTIEASMTALDSSPHYIFRDGTGQQVATGIYRLSSSSFEVTCDGVFPVQLTRSCMEIASAGSDCVTGACTF